MGTEKLHELTTAYLTDSITDAEGAELASLLQLPEYQVLFRELIHTQLQSEMLNLDNPSIKSLERIQQFLTTKINETKNDSALPVHRTHFLKTAWFRYAAAIICLIATGAYLWFQNSQNQAVTSASKQLPMDIVPGKEGAILTLADGTSVQLDTASSGNLAAQGNSILVQDSAGTLMYNKGKAAEGIGYNTITTPRGRQFHVILPDGSKVWLNVASSIRFPVAFTESRQIEVSGEVYFEVKMNKNHPFKVMTRGMEVDVLGTSFNINAYSNEANITTTLLDGGIRLIAGKSDSIVLKPGQQAIISNKANTSTSNEIFSVNNADLELVMAWRNGFFNFNKASFPEIIRQLERWYDIDASYKGEMNAIALQGKMQRDLNLSEMLELLSDLNIQYEIKGREIIFTTKQK